MKNFDHLKRISRAQGESVRAEACEALERAKNADAAKREATAFSLWDNVLAKLP
jgi:hypothetical protein